MENLFEYLEEIYNNNKQYQKDYELEDFITLFIRNSFGFTASLHEGFVDDELVCEFTPDVKLDFKNKTIEIVVEKN